MDSEFLDGDNLRAQVAGLTLPRHIAIVMDGNGRWAQERGLPRLAGHYEGRKATRRIVEAASLIGVEALSVYSFSTENWARPQDEVDGLMELIEGALREELDQLKAFNIRVQAVGRIHELPESMQRAFAYGADLTAECTGLKLNICVNYGGRAELVDAVRGIAADVAAGRLAPAQIEEQTIQAGLYSPEVPDVELFLRPGRELRVSNFLLWQIAYAEFVITEVLWPDFQPEHLIEAIRVFNTRQRRFGEVVEDEGD
jgi:undecaprenyl diphosphate synthase